MKINGRTFVITGGASGLGFACARDFISTGASVALLDLNPDTGERAAASLGPSATFIECDVCSSESVASAVLAVSEFIKRTGHPIGGLIPAAGIGFPGLMWNHKGVGLNFEHAKTVINVNLLGTIDVIRQFVPLLTCAPPSGDDGERAVIIMVSSSAAYDGQRGQVSYSASKGAVRSMTLPMARDLSPYGVRVVSVAPSMFDTAMTKGLADKTVKSLEKAMEFPKRPGKAHEFAGLVRAIIENVMLNGEVIRLDGAMRMPSKL